MSSQLLRADVESTLDREIRPFLARDQGDIRVTRIDDEGNVTLRLIGRCGGCPIASIELTNMVTEAVTGGSSQAGEVILDCGVQNSLVEEARTFLHRREAARAPAHR